MGISTPAIEEEIISILTNIEPELWILFSKVFIAFLVIYIVKSLVENWASYIMFRLNKYLGIGVRVKVDGSYGIIKDVDMKFIHIICDEGQRLIIPITNWKSHHWFVCLRKGEENDYEQSIHRTLP